MKLAVPDWQGRVSPVFDVAEQLLLVDFDGEEEIGRRMESPGSRRTQDRARRLAELEIDVLVCGAISWQLEALVAAAGIRVISLVRGTVDEVVRAFGEGTLENEQFAMPGCCRKNRHARNRRRRGHGGPISEETS